MDASFIIQIVLVLYFAVTGIIQVVTGKTVGNFSRKYTKESIRAYARPAGVIEIVIAILLLIYDLSFAGIISMSGMVRLILAGVTIVAIVIFLVFHFKTLKKK